MQLIMLKKAQLIFSFQVKNDYMQSVRDPSNFGNMLGVIFTQYEGGKAATELDIEDKHLNIGKTVHGGVINALCDIALSAAVTSAFKDKEEVVVTLQMNVNFLRPGFAGDKFIATAEVVKLGSKIVYVEGEIRNQTNKLIAKASGDWYVKSS